MNQKHKQNNHRIQTSLHHETYELADLLVKNRFVQTIGNDAIRYPIHRDLRFSARIELKALFDRLALAGDWLAHRLDGYNIILDGVEDGGVLIAGNGSRKMDYCSAFFDIWAVSIEAAEAASARILALAGEARITELMFAIDWHFLTARGQMQNVKIEERANDVLHDLAYPELVEGVMPFIDRFLRADETVLVLQGPPGTGKTRLIRAILGQMSRRKGEDACAVYTGDKRAVENDEIFVRFITGAEDAFIIEDADHLLKPRCDGNQDLHRFLTIADGVVRAQGRKIIFSTNLPNVGDLDEALIRPGRCFARVFVRELTRAEAVALIDSQVNVSDVRVAAIAQLDAANRKSFALANVYAAIGHAQDGVAQRLKNPLADAA